MGWSGYAVLSAVLGGLLAIVGKRNERSFRSSRSARS